MPDVAPVLPPFHAWIRRAAPDRYDLRFTVSSGRALLRTVLPGVTLDAPAQPAGGVEGLDAASLRASLLLHIEPVRLVASPYPFAGLDDAALAGLPADVWVALEPGPAGLRIGSAAGEPAPLITLAPAPAASPDDVPSELADPAGDSAAPPTGLVRHLRRQLMRQAARIAELEDDVRRLRGR